MEHDCDVLVMIYGMIGRDAHALIPIIYVLRKKYNLKVEIRSIFDYGAIDFLKPKVLLTNGCTGSKETYQVTKYASERGVYTVSLHAEGMFREENIESHIFGWNKDKKPTVKKWYMWNNNAYRWGIKACPNFKSVLDVAGSTLHEKYKIFHRNDFSREKLLQDRFDSIIFYAGWSFDKILQKYKLKAIKHNPEEERHFVTNCLMSIASKYSNNLLIMKYHPATFNESVTEISDYFNNFKNVMIIHDEYPIYELIINADVVISFDSTTTIDAWLAEKPTFNLYRGKKSIFSDGSLGYDYIRTGSLVPFSEKELLSYLDEFFTNGEIKDFKNKEKIRKKIILDYIGNIDKKPSLKIADHIYQSLDLTSKPKRVIDIKLLTLGLIYKIFYQFKFLPSIPPLSNMRKYYKPDEFQKQYDDFNPKLKQYFGF